MKITRTESRFAQMLRIEIKNPVDYHAALYIRLSKEDENEGPSGSVKNQQALLNEFVQQHSLPVYDTYIDDGWSGTNFARPDFKRMIADIEAGKVNMVVTKDLSRLGRDYILTGYYMERYFPEHHVRYISLLDGIDTGTETSANDITPFRAIMNDMYAKDISKKIRSVKRDKQRRGEFIGWIAVYGYKTLPQDKNHLVIDEEAAKVVRAIFAMAQEGISCRQIAVRLNEQAIPTPAVYAGIKTSRPGPYSGKWSSERVADMLKNETYIGNLVQGRVEKISYKSQKCLRKKVQDWVIVENTHEPIVDAETFDQVQQLLQSRRRTRSRTYDFLLKGLIFCHECQHPLGILNRKNARGEDILYLVCRTYQRFTKSGVCSSHLIRERVLTEAVLEKVREQCKAWLDPERLELLARSALKEADEANRKKAELERIKTRIYNLTHKMDRMYMDRLEDRIAEEDFTRFYQTLRKERDHLEIQQKKLEQQQHPVDQRERARELVQQFLDSAFTNRELLVSLIERIELTADKEVLIRFRFAEMNYPENPTGIED